MVLNTGAIIYGVIRSVRMESIKSKLRFMIIIFPLFLVLFMSSLFLVNEIRYDFKAYEEISRLVSDDKTSSDNSTSGLMNHSEHLLSLLIDRWVGIEGVMSVISYPDKSWGLWGNAWGEKFEYRVNSFFDDNIITSQYDNSIYNDDSKMTHSMQMPGVLAFCFYTGSYSFLFLCMFLSGVIASLIEICVYYLGGKNLILCALLAQVLATRYVHFG
jgi:hypothetical protein